MSNPSISSQTPATADVQTRTRATASHAQAQLKGGLSRAAQIGREGLASGAYLYPIKGVLYLLSHPSLLRPLLPTIALSIFVSLIITAGIFATLYLPAAGVLSIFNGPIGLISAATVLLSFSGTVVNALARSLFLHTALERLFDQVLLDHSLEALVARGRDIKKTSRGKRLGSALTKPLARFSPQALLTYLVSLPLNLVPLVGTVFFIVYNGVKGGPGWHARYFQLRKMGPAEREKWVRERRGAYSTFGATALALNLVPLASLFFTFTTQVGAALWACDEERRGGMVGRMDEGAGAVKRD